MPFLADYGSEKIMKKLVGRKEVEEARLQLDMLTKEESLMVFVRNLEITQDVDGNVKATKLVEDNVRGIEQIAHRVDNGTKHSLSIMLIPTLLLCSISHLRA